MYRKRQQLRTALGPLAIGLFHYAEQLLFIDVLRLKKNAEPEFFRERQKINRRLELLWGRNRKASIPMYYCIEVRNINAFYNSIANAMPP
jgi:hypothetical protein